MTTIRAVKTPLGHAAPRMLARLGAAARAALANVDRQCDIYQDIVYPVARRERASTACH